MYYPRISRKTSPSFGQTRIIQEPTPVKRYPPLSNVVQRAQQDPSSVTGDEWQQLQLAIGYRATKGLRSGEKTDWKPKFKGISALYAEQAEQKLPVQAKLVIGQPNDKYEQEADRVAGEVVQQIDTPTFIQLTSESLQPQPETESELQTKPETITIRRSPAPKLQREAVAGGKATENLTSEVANTRVSETQDDRLQKTSSAPIQAKEAETENKTGLPDNLKLGVENLSGYSLDNVRVHYNSPKPAQIQAHAYTQGTEIHVAPGQEKHLPHEAWHVVQQMQGRVKPTMQMKGVQIPYQFFGYFGI